VDSLVLGDGHHGYSTYHELLRKRFESVDGSKFLQMEISNIRDDGFGSGGVKINSSYFGALLEFIEFTDTGSDQIIIPREYDSYKRRNDTIIYNRITGIKKVMIRSYQPSFNLEFFR
jgi:hypothetical protein